MRNYCQLIRRLHAPLLYILLLVPTPQLAADPCAYLSTHILCNTSAWPKYSCYGINTWMGGAIVEITTDWTLGGGFGLNCNLVDNGGGGDFGRQVQVDGYLPGQQYPTNCWPCDSGCHWGWNPVQAGSCSPTGFSGVQQVTQQTNYLYTRTQPMHWDNELGRSNVVLEQQLQYVRWNALKITYTITNNESFTLQTSSYDVPVVYLEPRLNRAVTYGGSQPWTNSALTTLQIPVQNNTSINPAPREDWVAWLETYPNDGGDHGVALYVPFQNNWLVWGMGRLAGGNLQPTNFMQVFQTLTISPGQHKSVTAYLLTGTVEEMRASIYSLSGH